MEGWIKLHREIIDWDWYTDDIVKVVFLHLLLLAAHTPNKWRGIDIDVGEVITSYNHLAQQTGHTIQEVRTAIKKLKNSSAITLKATNKYTLISLVNYRVYQHCDDNEQQADNTQSNIQSTSNQHTANKQLTTNKNDNNVNNDKNEKKKYKYGDFQNVYLTDDEYKKLNTNGLSYLIDELSCYIASTGKYYASHYATIISWSNKRKKESSKLSSQLSFDIKKIEQDALYNDNYDI